MPQELLHPPAVPGNTQATAKHRAWLPPWLVVGGAPGRPVSALAPVNVALPFAQGTAQQGQTLTCTMGIWDNVPEDYEYAWSNGTITVGTGDTYTPVAQDVGTTLTCTVTARNAGGSASATSNSIGPILPAVPVNTVPPAITGNTVVGSVLTCSTGTWNNNPTSYTYQWVRVGTGDIGTGGNTYTTVVADEGYGITCHVTAINSGGSNVQGSNTFGPVTP